MDINSGTRGSELEVEKEKVRPAPRTGIPGDYSPSSPAAIPVPTSPSLSIQVPSSRSPSVQPPEPASYFDRNCARPRAPVIDRTPHGGLTWDQLHGRFSQRSFSREDAKDVLKTRLAPTAAAEEKRIPAGGGDMDASGAIAEKREREPAEGAMDSDIPTKSLGQQRQSLVDRHSAPVAYKGEVAELAKW